MTTPAEPKYSDAEISSEGLAERLRHRAAEERKIAENNARVAELLSPELELFNARKGHNIYATRMAIDHRNSAKRDADFAADLETAAALLASRPSTPDKAWVSERVVAGALFDLMGFLTTRDEAITLSGSHEASCAVQALQAFAEKRGLNLDEADVKNWRATLSHFAAQPAERVVEGMVLECLACRGTGHEGDPFVTCGSCGGAGESHR